MYSCELQKKCNVKYIVKCKNFKSSVIFFVLYAINKIDTKLLSIWNANINNFNVNRNMLHEEDIVFDFACLISEGWLDEIILPLDTDNCVSLC